MLGENGRIHAVAVNWKNTAKELVAALGFGSMEAGKEGS
jgi:hypothetical protein